MIRSWFGGKKEEAFPEELGPLGCAIGGALVIDTLGLEAALAAGDPAMGPPEGGTFVVAAVGTARLDGNSQLTRYYDDEDRIIQVIAPPGSDREAVQDVSLYRPWDSVVPAGRSEWQRWVGRGGLVGAPEYDADGLLFARYWGSGEDHADLVEFVETVSDGKSSREIQQKCMLYARKVGAVEEMLLLNIEQDLAMEARREGASIEFLIGYGLGIADIERV